MINIYLYVLIFFIIIYFYFSYVNNIKEGFEDNEDSLINEKYYNTKVDYESIYDDFYSFYADKIYFNNEEYKLISNIIIDNINTVFNNHLAIGIKHGGHINSYLNNTINTKSISKSKSIIEKCKYNYNDLDFEYINDYSSPYTFDNNEFTHISILDDELYYQEDIIELLSNCYEWLMFKGKLFLQVYYSKADFVNKYKNLRRFNIKRYTYTKQLMQNGSSNNYTFIEKIKLNSSSKERTNIHNLFYYDNDYIVSICKKMGLDMMYEKDIHNNCKLIVLQKVK